MRTMTVALATVALGLAPAAATAKAHHHHSPCGRTKPAHTNCGRHLGQLKHHRKGLNGKS